MTDEDRTAGQAHPPDLISINVTEQAELLARAWKRYVDLFGCPPHGTARQLAALLELMPKPPQPESAKETES